MREFFGVEAWSGWRDELAERLELLEVAAPAGVAPPRTAPRLSPDPDADDPDDDDEEEEVELAVRVAEISGAAGAAVAAATERKDESL